MRGGLVNAAIEFHDSKVTRVVRAGDAVVVRLTAYIHRSSGRPGFDAGSGWSQEVELQFGSGVVDRMPEELPFVLDDAHLSGGVSLSNMAPLPMSVLSAVRFVARGLYGEELQVKGASLAIIPLGEATYIEVFPGVKQG